MAAHRQSLIPAKVSPLKSQGLMFEKKIKKGKRLDIFHFYLLGLSKDFLRIQKEAFLVCGLELFFSKSRILFLYCKA